jgi:hypothetical protein
MVGRVELLVQLLSSLLNASVIVLATLPVFVSVIRGCLLNVYLTLKIPPPSGCFPPGSHSR